MDGEIEIELYKVDLAMKQDFNCEDFFRLFEYDGEGFISSEDLNYGLNLLNLESNEEVINLLMKRFDLLKENKLNYGDFFDMIVSFQSSYRNLIEKRIPLSKNPENILDLLDNETVSSFKVLLVSIIEFEFRINNMRKKLNFKEDKIEELFNLIDENKNGFLVYDDLIKYLIKNNIDSNNQLGMDLLFIRLDKERKGKLFLANFLEELRAL
jgi:Ca2+-binding EF-hand superfamily protein